MKRKDLDGLPDINFRIKKIIDEQFNGNVRKFSKHIGLNDSSRINRLFNKDTRYNNYPSPSLDIIVLISRALNCSTDYLINGEEKKANNINIDTRRNKIEGNDNIISDDSDVNIQKDASEYLEIIRKQQNQIDELIKVISSR